VANVCRQMAVSGATHWSTHRDFRLRDFGGGTGLARPIGLDSFAEGGDTSRGLTMVRPLVISVHGIRTRGAWQKQLTAVLNRAGFDHLPLDFGFFRAILLLWPPARQRQIAWFLEQYTAARRDSRDVPISVVAHSLGSYLVARSLEIFPEVRFQRVILCGSIVRRDYPWTRIIGESRQVVQVLNDYGRMDIWALIVGWVVSDSGASGRLGFVDDADGQVVQRAHEEFRHSDYFYVLNYEGNWVPFLKGTGPGPISAAQRRPANWRFRATATIAAIATLVLLGVAAWLSLRVRREAESARLACEALLQEATSVYARNQLSEAGRLFQESSACKNSFATLWTARALHRGLMGSSRDPEKARVLATSVFDDVRIQANAGTPAAEFLVGSAYLDGLGVDQNVGTALTWLRRAARHGYPLAQWSLGILLLRGESVARNDAEGEQLVHAAAENGVALAATELAVREDDRGNHVSALVWYRRASELGDPAALVRIGTMQEDGLGVAVANRCEACQTYERAAVLGVSDGQVNLGRCYEVGVEACSVEGAAKYQIDPCQAQQWYAQAAAANPPNPTGLYNLGISLVRGICKPAADDVERGLKYIENAAKAG
jgi:TPR repeat protein